MFKTEKKNINKENAKLILNVVHVLFYTIIYITTIYFSYNYNTEFDYGIRGYIVLALVYLLMLTIILNIFDAFKLGNKRISDIALSNIISLFFTDIISYFIFGLIEGHLVVVLPFIIMFIIQGVVSVGFSYYGNISIRANFPPKKTILIYGNSNYKETKEKLDKYQQYEFHIEKCASEDKIDYKTIYELLSKYESVITVDVSHDTKKKITKICFEKNINIYDVPSITDVFIKSSEITNFIDTPLFMLNKMKPSQFEKIIKRFIDIFGSLVLLVITLPITLVSALIIKLQDGGNVFFKQKRLTLNGKEFELIKFRSMIMNAEPDGKAIRAKINDERITSYGKFIRSTRIDELPQIINILKGDLSFVGPRALRVEEYEQNKEKFPEFEYRLKVKAGLTGYAQVYGKYNTSFRDKLLLDIYYIENYSIVMDIKLILMTFATMFTKDSTEGF